MIDLKFFWGGPIVKGGLVVEGGLFAFSPRFGANQARANNYILACCRVYDYILACYRCVYTLYIIKSVRVCVLS